MQLQCCTAGQMTCPMSTSPSRFSAMPGPMTTSGVPLSDIHDHVPMINIAPFGLCQSPATASPWSPGSPTVWVGGMPALNNSSTLNSIWSGSVSFEPLREERG